MKISSLRWDKQTQEQQILSIIAFPTVADPDLQIGEGPSHLEGEGEGGEGGGGRSRGIFFRPFGPQLVWSKNKGGRAPLDPHLYHARSHASSLYLFLYSLPQPSCTFIFMVHVSVQNVQVYHLAKQQVLPPQNLVLHFPRLADFPLCVQYSGK